MAQIRSRSTGIRPNQERLYWDGLGDVRVSLPALEDQRRIADFLDDQTSRIDAAIQTRSLQGRLSAEVLLASRQVRLDRLTEQFGFVRMRHVASRIEQGWSPQADSAPAAPGAWGVMRAGCVNGGVFRADGNKSLPADLAPRTEYEIASGDLLMSRASGSLDLIGSVAVVPIGTRSRLLLCDKLYRLVLGAAWQAEFVAIALRSHANRERIRLGVSGAEGMANNLPSGVIRDLEIPDATTVQQRDAVRELSDLECGHEVQTAHLALSISLLTEYKQSLITAAVTGEIDVTAASGRGMPA